MQYAMNVFEDGDNDKFTVIDRNGEPWFILSEVCKKLGIGNPSDVASKLDEDEKGVATIDTLGGSQKLRIVNESGLYSVILRSTKPEAKRFKKWVTSEVLPSIRKTGSYNGKTPAFIKRFNQNWDRVSAGHFSVISELAIRLHGRLEMIGHVIADRAPNGQELRPDGSVGKLFMNFLRKNHPDEAEKVSKYEHITPEWEGPANQFPNSVLPLFIEFVETDWIPNHSERYFNSRDPAALPFLPKLIANHKANAISAS
jgi:prophage antirepressor-like protein